MFKDKSEIFIGIELYHAPVTGTCHLQLSTGSLMRNLSLDPGTGFVPGLHTVSLPEHSYQQLNVNSSGPGSALKDGSECAQCCGWTGDQQ